MGRGRVRAGPGGVQDRGREPPQSRVRELRISWGPRIESVQAVVVRVFQGGTGIPSQGLHQVGCGVAVTHDQDPPALCEKPIRRTREVPRVVQLHGQSQGFRHGGRGVAGPDVVGGEDPIDARVFEYLGQGRGPEPPLVGQLGIPGIVHLLRVADEEDHRDILLGLDRGRGSQASREEQEKEREQEGAARGAGGANWRFGHGAGHLCGRRGGDFTPLWVRISFKFFLGSVSSREVWASEGRRRAVRIVGGKSELRRAGCRVTPGRRKATESAAESRPPMVLQGTQARVKGCGKSAPGRW